MKIVAVFTCFNRKEITKKCIQTLLEGNRSCEFTFVAVDDNSNDGTNLMLAEMAKGLNIHVIKGDGNLFYSGGMRMGMDYILHDRKHQYDYLLMVNDDVKFFNQCVERLIDQSKQQRDSVIVGATQDDQGNLSYSGIKYTTGIHYIQMPIEEWEEEVDTFNANCVLIPFDAFLNTGSIDSVYAHSLGDFDYGLSLKKNGYKLYVSKEYVGICNNNSSAGTWNDASLRRIDRIKRKETVKGAPFKQWYYFLKKNFGLPTAIIYSISPYIRIILGR